MTLPFCVESNKTSNNPLLSELITAPLPKDHVASLSQPPLKEKPDYLRKKASASKVAELTQKFNQLGVKRCETTATTGVRYLHHHHHHHHTKGKKASEVQKVALATRKVSFRTGIKTALAKRTNSVKKLERSSPSKGGRRSDIVDVGKVGAVRATIRLFESGRPVIREEDPQAPPEDGAKGSEAAGDGAEERKEVVVPNGKLRCESMYEPGSVREDLCLKPSRSEASIVVTRPEKPPLAAKPNTSFLWRAKSVGRIEECSEVEPQLSLEPNVEPSSQQPTQPPPEQPIQLPPQLPPQQPIPPIPQLPIQQPLELPLQQLPQSVYEEVRPHDDQHNYEDLTTGYEDYTENLYERLGTPPGKKDDCYEPIGYETISSGGSTLSSDQRSNSLYERTQNPGSSDSSDWIDISDSDERRAKDSSKTRVRRQRSEKRLDWSVKVRNQRFKTGLADERDDVSESDLHHYESLFPQDIEEDYDSFESDSYSDTSMAKVNPNDSGVDMENSQLPPPPNSYSLTKLAKKLKRNWSLTKNDITRSLNRIKKNKFKEKPQNHHLHSLPVNPTSTGDKETEADSNGPPEETNLIRTPSKRRLWFKRSTSELQRQSTFYLTETVNIDEPEPAALTTKSELETTKPALRPPERQRKGPPVRPKSPPPSVPQHSPKRNSASTASWYDARDDDYEDSSEPPALPPRRKVEKPPQLPPPPPPVTAEYGNARPLTCQLHLEDEPLYQFYDAAILQEACAEAAVELDPDGYEEIGDKKPTRRPSAMQLVSPERLTSGRTLWSELPEVTASHILDTMTANQKKLQEAKFEIITSEASYLKSLALLENHFVDNLNKETLANTADRKIMFSHVKAVRECSERLLAELEICWQDSILLNGLCKILAEYATKHFEVYVSYCQNQVHLDRTLNKLKDQRGPFAERLRQLETSPECHGLSLYSFLMLPMQRATRLPLLVDAVLRRLAAGDEEHPDCGEALASLNALVRRCNEAARLAEQREELARTAALLEMPAGAPDLQHQDRWLVRSGRLQRLKADVRHTFGRKPSKQLVYLYLFNDLLLVAAPKKASNAHLVMHYCSRNLVEAAAGASAARPAAKESPGKHILLLTMLEDQDGRTVELLLSCESETDRERWLEALSPPVSQDPDETLYEGWDCPQVMVVHAYAASQPDELPLAQGDIVNVLRKMTDGWFQGERIRDGRQGWFPGNHTVEIVSQHIRAKHLRQRYRLLAFSTNYLSSNA